MKTLIRSICLLALFSACQPIAEAEAPAAHPVLTGLEVLLSDSLHLIEGKRIGLVTNQTGVDSRGRSGISLLFNEKRTQLSTLFAPEHGIDGSKPAGQAIGSGQHAATGLPIVSLYSGIHVVDPGLFKNLDMVLVDLQDVGIRPYTYISTMDGVMVACGKANIPCLVLDRPNPIGGNTVGGEVLDPEFRSFIGVHEIPYLHGMTMGELARLFQGEFGSECDLTVVPMRGWQRGMNFARTGLPWIPTSPNVPTAETPLLMALTGGIGELGGVSIGIGTALPFRLLGQDTMDAWDLARRLNARALPGLQFLPWSWTPSLGGYKDRLCQGVYIHVDDFGRIDLAEAQWALLDELYRGGVPGKAMLEGKEERFRMYDKAMGSSRLRRELPKDPKGLAYLGLVRDQVREFRQLRKPYLLYPED
ncbi:MAG: DUF1343 domain-containing protein [Candidatus Cloacimonetes bacterium]|nr:DUF1343 domain-containing protein [Candidatus Cloacimonadota bacterium]